MNPDIKDRLNGTHDAVKQRALAKHFNVSQEEFHQILINVGVDRLFNAIDLKKPSSLLELHNHLYYDMAMFKARIEEMMLMKTQLEEREAELQALIVRTKRILDQEASKLNQAP